MNRGSFLALRTIVRSPSAKHDALDSGTTNQTWLTCSHVHAVPELEEPFATFGIHIVGNRGSSESDCIVQYLLDGSMQGIEFGPREPSGGAAGTNPRSKKRFIGIDIPHAMKQLLVQKRGFDGRLAAAKQLRKLLGRNGKWFSSRSGEICRSADAQTSESPGIDEPQLSPRSQGSNCMRVLGEFFVRRSD